MADPFITVDDMVRFGYADDFPEEVLDRVCSRIRRHTRQTISRATSTAKGRSPIVLPQYPVIEVTTVTDDLGNVIPAAGYTQRGNIITGPVCPGINDFEINLGTSAARRGWLTVVYESGWDEGEVPDTLVELACSIAARLNATSDAGAAGIRSRTVGDESITFAAEALSGGLTADEKADLDAVFPAYLSRGPRTIDLAP